MNDLTVQKIQLPAHLASLAGRTDGAALIGGIATGAAFHSIGIKAARWRLNDPQGQEVVVPHHHLDVIVLDANPYMSRKFYLKAYDPNSEPAAPDCFSDNGVGPSVRAVKPQSATCAQCPNAVLGSKVNPNGSKSMACSESKIIAVLLSEDPTGPVYQLRVPYMSSKNLRPYIESLLNRGVPYSAVVTRLTFDTASDYPKIVFAARPQTPEFPHGPWITAEQSAAVLEVLDSDEVSIVTNRADVARTAPLPAPAVPAVNQAMPFNPPAQPAAVQTASNAMAAAPASAPVQEAPKRTRRTKAELAAAAAATVGPAAPTLPAQPSPAANFFASAAAAQAPKPPAQVVANPQPTNQALDDLLANAFKV